MDLILQINAYMIAAGATAAIAVASGLICFFGTREVVEQAPLEEAVAEDSVTMDSGMGESAIGDNDDDDAKTSVMTKRPSAAKRAFKALKMVVTFKPYLQLMFAFLFQSLAIQVCRNVGSIDACTKITTD